MRAGQLNRRVTLQSPVSGADESGQPLTGWQAIGTVWASIRVLTGIESIKSDAQVSIAKASIRIRYRADITTAMRVLHGAKAFEIVAVLPDEQKREHIDLVCHTVS